MRTPQEGVAFLNYTLFKAFLEGSAEKIVFWEDVGDMLNVSVHYVGGQAYWCSSEADDKAAFHTDFNATSYEVK